MTYLANRPSRRNQILSLTPIIRTLVRSTPTGRHIGSSGAPNGGGPRSSAPFYHSLGRLIVSLPTWLAWIMVSLGGTGMQQRSEIRGRWRGHRLLPHPHPNPPPQAGEGAIEPSKSGGAKASAMRRRPFFPLSRPCGGGSGCLRIGSIREALDQLRPLTD